jgi:hypothetical protein
VSNFNPVEAAIKAAGQVSVDDEPKNWDFKHFDRVACEMGSGSTSVGSILAAMIYQIEKQNSEEPEKKKETESTDEVKQSIIGDLDSIF